MKAIFHPSDSRGHANHGWLNSHHSFSFANYYNPEKMHFGVLRVLNDDTIQGGTGFGKHPHQNMEIISIPLDGSLQHVDSMGNKGLISTGEVQVMSAGTGIIHSEMNGSATEPCSFLQLWIIPNEQNLEPRYGQQKIDTEINKWVQLTGPRQEIDKLWINQDAHIYQLKTDSSGHYDLSMASDQHGFYIFLLDGSVNIEEYSLQNRDALGVWEVDKISLTVKEPSHLLVIEVPMILP